MRQVCLYQVLNTRDALKLLLSRAAVAHAPYQKIKFPPRLIHLLTSVRRSRALEGKQSVHRNPPPLTDLHRHAFFSQSTAALFIFPSRARQ